MPVLLQREEIASFATKRRNCHLCYKEKKLPFMLQREDIAIIATKRRNDQFCYKEHRVQTACHKLEETSSHSSPTSLPLEYWQPLEIFARLSPDAKYLPLKLEKLGVF